MSTTKFTPIGDRVLVMPIADERQSELEIPESAQAKPVKGKVIAVGSDINPEEISVGDTVLYRKMVGVEVEIDNVPHLFLSRGKGDIFASIKEEAQ